MMFKVGLEWSLSIDVTNCADFFMTLSWLILRYEKRKLSSRTRPNFFSLSFRNCKRCGFVYRNCNDLLYNKSSIPQFL